MEILTKLRALLATLGEECTLQDFSGDTPGEAALFAHGSEELSRRTTICGRVQVRYRHRFTLYKCFAAGGGISTEGAAWAQGLQGRINALQVAGEVPVFGTPGRQGEVLRAYGAARESAPASGVALYGVQISLDTGG